MGMIKLPNDSLSFFRENLDEIFETGALAEGKWSKICENQIIELTNINNAVMCNSNGAGLHAVLRILKEK